MACTFRLRDHLGVHPVATIMMRDMIARLNRPARTVAHAATEPPVAANP